jgi:hypothetical protein
VPDFLLLLIMMKFNKQLAGFIGDQRKSPENLIKKRIKINQLSIMVNRE